MTTHKPPRVPAQPFFANKIAAELFGHQSDLVAIIVVAGRHVGAANFRRGLSSTLSNYAA